MFRRLRLHPLQALASPLAILCRRANTITSRTCRVTARPRGGLVIIGMLALVLAQFAPLGLFGQLPAYAANTWYVAAGGADSPSCGTAASPCATIGYAITNLAASGDTINIGPGTFPRVNIGFSGSLTLTGAGASATFIDGGGTGIGVTVGQLANVTMSGVTVQDGKSVRGAGIDDLGNLTLSNATVTGNHIDTSGGADDCASQGVGGGILVSGSAVLQNVTVTGNTDDGGDGPSGACGAGIFAASGSTLTIGGSTITNNTLTDTSGVPPTGDYDGGGIAANGATVTITNSTISNNTAVLSGGGIYQTGGSLTISSSTSISGNQAASGGGGAYIGAGTNASMDHATLAGNTACAGGGIDNKGTLTLQNAAVSNNTVTSPSSGCSGTGGGLYNAFHATLQNVVVTGNTDDGGTGASGLGIFAEASGTLRIDGSTISNNRPATGGTFEYGGGLAGNQATVTITNSTISGNSAGTNDSGGGIGAGAQGTWTVTNSTIDGNTAPNGGGGIDIGSGTTAYLDHSTVTHNTAAADNGGNGGGIQIAAGPGPTGPGTLRIKNTIVAYNTGQFNATFNSNCDDFSGLMTTLGNNVIGQLGCGVIVPQTSDQVGSTATHPIDPQLGPLTDNGGPTLTEAPLAGSPAVSLGSTDATRCTDLLGNLVTIDQRGVARPSVGCTIGAVEAVVPATTTNDTWSRAMTLTPTQTVTDTLTASSRERWYKFPVSPGATVHVSFTGAPGQFISLHSDVQAMYNSLTSPSNAAVEGARDVPVNWIPVNWIPVNWIPVNWIPVNWIPVNWIPVNWIPVNWIPADLLPSGPAPSGYTDGPYNGAVLASTLAVSGTPNSTVQTIDHNTWNSFGYFYVRVGGVPNASANPQFSLTVSETGGVCAGVTPIAASPVTGTIPTGLNSLILWDPTRISGSASDISTLSSKLTTFAGRSEVGGTVVDLSANAGIESAQAQADAHPSCPTAKNLVAQDIKSVITAYRQANPTLQDIVLVGDDHSIPFFRYPDEAGLGLESQYYPPVQDTSASNASLRNNFVLGQDEYGASTDLPLGDLSLPIPDLAVGRLVTTAADVSHMLDVYTNANGALAPQSSLVTGYDFLADAATNAANDLAAGTGAGATPSACGSSGSGSSPCQDTLITPPNDSGPPPTPWTAGQLQNTLTSSHHDIVFLAAHFSAGNLLAADDTTTLSAPTLAASSANLTNTLVLALGCHGGYNIPPGDDIAGATPSPDWAQAFAEKGATLLALTGYGYGDTVLTEYGEHLFDNVVHQLRMGTGPVAIGQAEILAKKEYLATHTNLSGVDEKTLLETALYGLPTFSINMPAGRITPSTPASIVAGTSAVAGNPYGLALGQSGGSSTIDIQPALTSHSVQLTNASDGTTVNTTYLSGRDGTLAQPLDPILPQQIDDVHVSNEILRGVGFRGGTYTDSTGITPLTSAPGTDSSTAHPAFSSNVLFPKQVWAPNFFNAIGGGDETLVTTPAQYVSATNSDGSLATSGTLRQFSDLQFQTFYLPSNWTTNSSTVPAATASPPSITQVSSSYDGTNVNFSVSVAPNTAAPAQNVWITWTDPSSGCGSGAPCTWSSVDLTPSTNNTVWLGSLALPSGVSSQHVRFMVQAANNTGLVTLDTNGGAYYTVGAPPAPWSLTGTTSACSHHRRRVTSKTRRTSRPSSSTAMGMPFQASRSRCSSDRRNCSRTRTQLAPPPSTSRWISSRARTASARPTPATTPTPGRSRPGPRSRSVPAPLT